MAATKQSVALLDLSNIADSVARLREQVEAGDIDDETFEKIRNIREEIIHL